MSLLLSNVNTQSPQVYAQQPVPHYQGGLQAGQSMMMVHNPNPQPQMYTQTYQQPLQQQRPQNSIMDPHSKVPGSYAARDPFYGQPKYPFTPFNLWVNRTPMSDADSVASHFGANYNRPYDIHSHFASEGNPDLVKGVKRTTIDGKEYVLIPVGDDK
eukprot:TRINITY_DN41310_c0_g1_i1.p1 TRINITY_DN41310_c0_g1~~TRINITY_DN41310_c0_g1_i1.p1  ORF type:complete len:157 (+),score=11.68 TRINITY_DN41310_c0_g1_i1:13-483(+)